MEEPMARKRMIDPSFWEDENIGKLSRDARLLYIGLFSNADDYGRIRANAAYLRSTIFMYDDLTLNDVLALRNELVQAMKSVVLYTIDGNDYIELLKWDTYQKQQKDRIQESQIPPRTQENSEVLADAKQVLSTSVANDDVDKIRLDKTSLDKINISLPSAENINFSALDAFVTKPSRVSQEFQDYALRMAESLGIKKPSSSWFAFFKKHGSTRKGLIDSTYAAMADLEGIQEPEKYFFKVFQTKLEGG